MAVDQAELGRRHAELDAAGAIRRSQRSASSSPPPSAWPLIAASDRRGVGVDRLDRRVERVGDERLGVALEALVGDRADVVAGGEHALPVPVMITQRRRCRVERRHRRGERVEDLVVERVALARGSRCVRRATAVGRLVEEQLPGELSSAARLLEDDERRRPRRPTGPPRSGSPSTLPASSASTGISIFIDSRITTVSPSSTLSPTFDLDLPDRAGDVSLDVGHRARHNSRR